MFQEVVRTLVNTGTKELEFAGGEYMQDHK
jgi:hypothetical protein